MIARPTNSRNEGRKSRDRSLRSWEFRTLLLPRSRVTSLLKTFRDTEAFDHDLDGWDTSSVTTLRETFYATLFDGTVGSWDTAKVTDMTMTFESSEFNQPIGSWDISQVTDMTSTFDSSRGFNQPIGDWDASRVTDLTATFLSNPAFTQQDIGGWDTSQVRCSCTPR